MIKETKEAPPHIRAMGKGEPPTALPSLISQHRQLCHQQGVDPDISSFPMFSEAEFEQIKKDSIMLFAYSNRFITQVMEYQNSPRIVFALFDEQGCLLRLYGTPKSLDNIALCGISVRTNWSGEAIGTNAVSLGLKYSRAVEISGAQNHCQLLSNCAVYFSPVILEEDASEISVVCGGIAIIVPLEHANPAFLMTVVAITGDVNLHLFMSNYLYRVYLEEERGMAMVDIDTRTGKMYFMYYNNSLLKVLDVPYTDLYFKSIDTLFDPLPKNQEFWTVLKERLSVSNCPIRLSVKGKEDEYLVTSEPYYQKRLGFSGLRFFFTSSKVISAQVSKKIGNNAIITFQDILGNSPCIQETIRYAKIISKSDGNVLILGESGAGKDIYAQAIHNASKRCNKPFIAVNCAAFPRELIASELFGYDGGAFTGSRRNGNIGKFELANTGTIFLDEIGNMPLELQAVLLRVIEQKSFMRLGGNTLINVDVKIIAATNANLSQLVEQRKFRADLYYRLSTLCLKIPPLRERGNDVILLAEHFISLVSKRIQRSLFRTLSEETKKLLLSLPWKGNVRELQNIIEGIVHLYPVTVIEPKHIRQYLGMKGDDVWGLSESPAQLLQPAKKEAYALSEEQIADALRVCRYNKSQAARHLGISRNTLYRHMEKLGMR